MKRYSGKKTIGYKSGSIFILFYGVDAECDCAVEGGEKDIKTNICIVLGIRPGMINKRPVIL